jgi:hypothetical protein
MKHVEPRALRFSSSSGGGYRFLVPAAAYLVGGAVFFRWQLFSGFDLLSGNSGDTRFIIAIHEHLFQVLHGRGTLLSPPFFYDTPGTLGYSDAFILNEALYAPLRLLGAEPFLALLLVPILLSAPAYLFTFLFLRRFGGASVAVATAGALLFTFPNNLYLKSGQVQHFVAYYLPIVLYCATSAIADVHRARVRSCLLSAAAGILCGLVFSTGYYISWFFGIALVVFAPIFIWQGWPAVRNWWQVNPRSILVLAWVFTASFIVALIPFVLIYLPVMRIIGPRSFAEYLVYAPQFIDIFNVGPSNIFWGGLVRHFVPDRPATGGRAVDRDHASCMGVGWSGYPDRGGAAAIADGQFRDHAARRRLGLCGRLRRPVPRDHQGRLAVVVSNLLRLCARRCCDPRRLSRDDRRQSFRGHCHCARLRQRPAAAPAPLVRLSRESRPCSAGACRGGADQFRAHGQALAFIRYRSLAACAGCSELMPELLRQR